MNKSQITSFVIDVTKDKERIGIFNNVVNNILFSKIFSVFVNLQYVNIGPWSNLRLPSLFEMPYPSAFSSNLLELHMREAYFTDVLYILDGRFNQLHTFHVNIRFDPRTSSTIPSRVNYF
jgi:hypothetical protein